MLGARSGKGAKQKIIPQKKKKRFGFFFFFFQQDLFPDLVQHHSDTGLEGVRVCTGAGGGGREWPG